MVAEAGTIDIAMNATSTRDIQGTPIVEMDVENYLRPVETVVRSQFNTAKATGRHMKAQGSGVMLFFGGYGEPMRGYSHGGFQTALQAMDSMRRQLGVELGPYGVRTVTLRTGGVVDAIPEGFKGRDALMQQIDDATLTGRAARLEDVGDVAAFVASDRARTMTAATVNVSAGFLID